MNTPRASRRALRFGVLTLIMLVAVTASVVLANVLGERFARRVDVTETGEHRLAPRTENLLDSLDKPYRIVIAADYRQLDPRARQRVVDVLEKFARRSPLVQTVQIDTSAPDGVGRYDSLLRELVARDADRITASLETLRKASTDLGGLADQLSKKVSPALAYLRDRFPPAKVDKTTGAETKDAKGGTHEAIQQRIDAVDALAKDFRAVSAEVAGALAWDPASGRPPETAIPQRRLTEALNAGRKVLVTLAGELAAFQKADSLAADAKGLARAAQLGLEKIRDAAAITSDAVARLPKLDVVRLAEALKAPAAVLIVGPEGLSAIDPISLFPPGELLDLGGAPLADMRRKSEDLLATAISSLRNPIKPIVVLMHAEASEFLDRAPLLSRARERLALRGIDMVEWAVAVNPAAPDLSALDPKGVRPIVYAVFSTAAWTASDSGGPSGAERSAKLGGALDAIAESGRPLLVSLNPSPLPSYGQKDPIASVLERFGINPDAGRPLLREVITPRGRVADTDMTIQGAASEHPLADAIGRLPISLPWCVPLALKSDLKDVRVTPLCQVKPDSSIWAESNWLGLRKTRREDRALIPDQPAFDQGKDDNQGPWTVIAAAERALPGNATQRVLAVGSNDWFIDPVLSAESIVDGRVVAQSPGNIELLESGVAWLAGQDELIARSPAGQSAPMVKPIEHQQMVTIRIAFIAGVPIVILGLGVLYRAVFG